LSVSKVAEISNTPWCELIAAASIPSGCTDPDLPLRDAFKGAIVGSKPLK
jgi:hypothetical protein